MDQVKLKLSQLFNPELGFIKSANLAAEIIKYGSSNYSASNENQMVISSVLKAASTMPRELLWCHQKATGKKWLVFQSRNIPRRLFSRSIMVFKKGGTIRRAVWRGAALQRRSLVVSSQNFGIFLTQTLGCLTR
jgi:hypothetical protein